VTDLAYEVQAIELLPARNERLLGFQLDSPTVGNRRNVYVLHLIGWAVGRDARAESVEVVYHERVLRTVPVRGPRSDVAAALGIAPETDCVFHALVGLIGLKPESTLSCRVVLEDGSRIETGSITVRREPLRTDYDPMLAPLMVTTLGRSGSTWLLQILASHPEVVVFRQFPYGSFTLVPEIFLVRDFRDMARSIMAFDEKRGFAGFGRPDGVSDEQYMRGELRQMAHDLHRSWETRHERAHLVRYEDLVLHPVETLTAMLEYLEVDASAPTVQEVLRRGAEQILPLPGGSSSYRRSRRTARWATRRPRSGAGATKETTRRARSPTRSSEMRSRNSAMHSRPR
jgi:Sulfotransferase family